MTTGAPDRVRAALRRPGVRAVVAVVLVLLLGAVVWAAARGGPEDGSPGAAPGSTTTGSPSAEPDPSPSASTEEPGAAGPEASEEPAEPSAEPGTEPDAEPGTDLGEEDPRPFVPEVEPAVGLDAPAPFGTGVVARLVRIDAVEGVAQGPGEVSGPSLSVVVELTNGTASAVSLDTTVVELYAGPDELPGLLLAGSEAGLLSGDLAPGASAVGTYVFRVPPELRDLVRVTVSYDPSAPTVLFEGPAPAA